MAREDEVDVLMVPKAGIAGEHAPPVRLFDEVLGMMVHEDLESVFPFKVRHPVELGVGRVAADDQIAKTDIGVVEKDDARRADLLRCQLRELDLVVAVREKGRGRVGAGLQKRERPPVRLAVPVDDVSHHEDGVGAFPGHLGDDVVKGFIVNVGQHDELIGTAHVRADALVGRQFHQVLHSTRTSPEPSASARPSGSVTEPMRV